MKTMTVGEFKAHFSDVVEQVKAGAGFAVTYGRKKEIVGYFLPGSQMLKPKRQLGIVKDKVQVSFKPDYQITEEDML